MNQYLFFSENIFPGLGEYNIKVQDLGEYNIKVQDLAQTLLRFLSQKMTGKASDLDEYILQFEQIPGVSIISKNGVFYKSSY